MAEWIWMKHEGHGGVTRFPVEARAGWEGRGWAECPAPEETEDVPAVSGQEKGKVKRNG